MYLLLSSLTLTVDYDKVITHYIQLDKYEDALEILTEQATIALQCPDKASSQYTTFIMQWRMI